MAFTLQIGAPAPEFSLPGIDGKTWSLEDVEGAKILVVVFRCNHCPFVVESEERINRLYSEYGPKGVALIGINSNETVNHPTDSFEHMVTHAKEHRIKYPYVHDESQDVARAYGALRTPHFYVFDEKRRLRYTGRLDDSPREPAKATTQELREVLDALLAGKNPPAPVTNPIGCNVKWKGKDPHWMPAEACDLV
ncbi:MAG: thioredoxin family protein [Phycisphaerae bacterium]|nr:thioredoxin family protein [Phycisphaerae bacterium]